MWYSQIKIE